MWQADSVQVEGSHWETCQWFHKRLDICIHTSHESPKLLLKSSYLFHILYVYIPSWKVLALSLTNIALPVQIVDEHFILYSMYFHSQAIAQRGKVFLWSDNVFSWQCSKTSNFLIFLPQCKSVKFTWDG